MIGQPHVCPGEGNCCECYAHLDGLHMQAMKQIAALTAERDAALKVRDLAREASNRDLQAKRDAEAERDALREQIESVCSYAEVVGYYGDRADSVGVCFVEAYQAMVAERDAEKQRADRAEGQLAAKTLEWEGERAFIEQVESWVGADCRGSVGTGIHAAIARLASERDAARRALVHSEELRGEADQAAAQAMAERDRLELEVTRLRDALRAGAICTRWDSAWMHWCHVCKRQWLTIAPPGHAPDCIVGLAPKGGEE